jgi:hypothetical protein
MGNVSVLMRHRSFARRRSRALLLAVVLPTGATATAGVASLLAILLAFVSAVAATGKRAPPPDDVGWAEFDDFLPRNATLEQALGKIRRARIVTSGLIGYSGRSSSVYDASLRLARLASDEQLRALISDPSPAVRVYAFDALTARHGENVAYDLLLSRLGDDEPVRTQYGCIRTESTVFDAMLELAEHRLSTAQLADLRERKKPPR